jgi:hypothetical protein
MASKKTKKSKAIKDLSPRKGASGSVKGGGPVGRGPVALIKDRIPKLPKGLV